MLLRSGRATSPTIGPRRRSFRCGSSCSSVEAARRLVGLLPRKGSAARRLKSRSPPASPEKQPVTPPSPEVPVEAPLPPAQYGSPGEDGSSRASVEDESPPGVIKRSVDDEPSPTRRVKSRTPPEPSQKQLIALPLPEAGAGVTLHPPKVGTLAQHGGAGEDGTDEGSIAELGIKLFPCLPSDQAAALWVGFVNDAKTCIKQYNIKHKANFVYKHEPSNGFYRVEEQDDRAYYHTNFYAQDEYGHSQLFFGEIKECVRPQVEDVTCCCPVSSSDTGGVGFRTVEEALMYDFPDLSNVGYDAENCYACTARVKHPKGTLYVGGHFADVRQYYGFSD